MVYKVVVTKDAEDDLERFLKYLIFEKQSLQVAKNVMNDYDATVESLRYVAGSLKLCNNPRLHQLKYRRINFLNHRYFMLYRIDNMAYTPYTYDRNTNEVGHESIYSRILRKKMEKYL